MQRNISMAVDGAVLPAFGRQYRQPRRRGSGSRRAFFTSYMISARFTNQLKHGCAVCCCIPWHVWTQQDGGSASGPISRPFSLTCKMHHSYRENYSRTLLCVRNLHGRGLLLFLCTHNKRTRPNSPSTPPVAPHRAVLPDTLCGFGVYMGNGRSSEPRCLRPRFHARCAWPVELLAEPCHRYTSRRDGKGTGYHARPIAAYPSSNGLRYS
jgi:hypothetical protein